MRTQCGMSSHDCTQHQRVRGGEQTETERAGERWERDRETQRYSLPRSSFMSEDRGGGEARVEGGGREVVRAGREREGM